MKVEGSAYDAFLLMAGVTNATRKKMDAILKTVDLTFPQYGALMMLEEHTHATQTELAQLLGTDTTTAMVICDSLQKKGYLRRVPDAHDRRVNRLELTNEGLSALRRAEPLMMGYYGPIVAALGEEDWKTLVEKMNRLLVKIREANAQ